MGGGTCCVITHSAGGFAEGRVLLRVLGDVPAGRAPGGRCQVTGARSQAPGGTSPAPRAEAPHAVTRRPQPLTPCGRLTFQQQPHRQSPPPPAQPTTPLQLTCRLHPHPPAATSASRSSSRRGRRRRCSQWGRPGIQGASHPSPTQSQWGSIPHTLASQQCPCCPRSRQGRRRQWCQKCSRPTPRRWGRSSPAVGVSVWGREVRRGCMGGGVGWVGEGGGLAGCRHGRRRFQTLLSLVARGCGRPPSRCPPIPATAVAAPAAAQAPRQGAPAGHPSHRPCRRWCG